MSYEEETRCRTHLLNALVTEMDKRRQNPDTWIENERFAITAAANVWAEAHDLPTRLSVDDVEGIEQLAVGHTDYARKLALYVGEMIYGHRPVPQVFSPSPVNCSNAGHKTRFRTGADDGCDTCGVKW